MLNASDALRAHNYCRFTAAQQLQHAPGEMDLADLAPHADCALVRFVHECEANHTDWIEVDILKAAHASFHEAMMELAQKRLAQEPVDIVAEMARDSRLNRASEALVSAIWRLQGRLNSPDG